MSNVINFDKLEDRDHAKVSAFIDTNVGIQLPLSKKVLVETRLRKRQRALGIASLHDYIHFTLDTEAGRNEQIYLIDALTTNKTDFYREPYHFEFLRLLINEIISNNPTHLKLWSAGCSSGEEPYTLAMELLEAQFENSNLSFEIDATDISLSCLKKAKSGIYQHEQVVPVPKFLRKKYLLRSANKALNLVQMSSELKEKINFEYFNLLNDDYSEKVSRYDMIFCRNVMIYFNNKVRSRLTRFYAQSLRVDGLLFIGHSETLLDPYNLFERVESTIYRRLP